MPTTTRMQNFTAQISELNNKINELAEAYYIIQQQLNIVIEKNKEQSAFISQYERQISMNEQRIRQLEYQIEKLSENIVQMKGRLTPKLVSSGLSSSSSSSSSSSRFGGGRSFRSGFGGPFAKLKKQKNHFRKY
jgi:predicted RNase H-like nuclease (RuvC/YqgF family)